MACSPPEAFAPGFLLSDCGAGCAGAALAVLADGFLAGAAAGAGAAASCAELEVAHGMASEHSNGRQRALIKRWEILCIIWVIGSGSIDGSWHRSGALDGSIRLGVWLILAQKAVAMRPLSTPTVAVPWRNAQPMPETVPMTQSLIGALVAAKREIKVVGFVLVFAEMFELKAQHIRLIVLKHGTVIEAAGV